MNRLFSVVFLSILFSVSARAYETYQYTGHISEVVRNTIGAAVAVNDPVTMEFTFDALTPDGATFSDDIGSYSFSGGDTNFEMMLGSFSSTPVDNFHVGVVTKHLLGTDNQYNFLTPTSELMRLNFPGLISNVPVSIHFGLRVRKIASDDLFQLQPNPADFEDMRIVVGTGLSPTFSVEIVLDPTGPADIPEPTSLVMLMAGGFACLLPRRSR